jgi:hypothetical protein
VAYALGGAASSAASRVGTLRAAADTGLAPDIIVGLGAASTVVFDALFAAFDAMRHQLLCDVEYASQHVPVLCIPGQPTTHVKSGSVRSRRRADRDRQDRVGTPGALPQRRGLPTFGRPRPV